MKKYHVAMVIARYPPTIGGTELQCRELSKSLAGRGHHVSVLTEQNEPNLPQREVQEGIDIYRFPVGNTPFIGSLRYARQLKDWLQAHPETDLLHAHMLAGPAMAAYWVTRRMKKPVVLKIAGAGITGDIGTSRQRWRGHLKLALFRRWAGFISCPSSRTYQEIISLGVLPAQLRLIPNGVSTERFHPLDAEEKAAMRSRLQLDPSGPLAIYVGRWAEGKGIERLLSAWESLRSEGSSGWKLLLVISQPPPAAAQPRLQKLAGRVHVVVAPADTMPYYQAADLAILLSENEGLSNFILEAMASGLPLLTSPGAAVAPVEESSAWSWIAPADPKAIGALISQIQNDSAALAAKGSAARAKALAAFSLSRTAEQYENLYEEAIQGA